MCSSPQSVRQTILVQKSKFHDFQALRSVAIKPSTPELCGVSTKLTRIQGHGLNPRTRAMYTPLIDMTTPSDPTYNKNCHAEAKETAGRATRCTSFKLNNQLVLQDNLMLLS